MGDRCITPAAPRWGNQQRDRKARAIWLTIVDMQSPGIGNGTWMDMGCGSGGIAHGLASRVHQIIGVDPEPWADWERLATTAPNLDFRVAKCDAVTPPADPESMDVIVCNQVYEHVADPRQLIRNIAKLLKPGGCCYFAGPNLLWPIEPHVFWPFVHWLPRKAARRVMRALGSKQAEDLDAFSAHHWRLRSWFREAGLSCSPAVAARVSAELALRGLRLNLPGWCATLTDRMVPLSPGLVYLLRKP